MIDHIIQGDITSSANQCDIIIGMNRQLEDVTGIGRTFVKDVIPSPALDLGSVITFPFDERRRLHMIICHNLDRGGWIDADKHVRFGMDFINQFGDKDRNYSIVQIGTGRVGKRDGADYRAIRTAMANSFLLVDLYIYDGPRIEAVADVVPLRPLFAWNPASGPVPLQAAA